MSCFWEGSENATNNYNLQKRDPQKKRIKPLSPGKMIMPIGLTCREQIHPDAESSAGECALQHQKSWEEEGRPSKMEKSSAAHTGFYRYLMNGKENG